MESGWKFAHGPDDCYMEWILQVLFRTEDIYPYTQLPLT